MVILSKRWSIVDITRWNYFLKTVNKILLISLIDFSFFSSSFFVSIQNKFGILRE